jgi:hypothetical protein
MECGDPDALIRPPVKAGLLHRIADEFAFSTPAAFHLVSLVGHVI